MARKFTFALMLLSLWLTASGQPKSALLTLDSLIEIRHEFESLRRADIDNASVEFLRAADDQARYNALRNLYESYRSFKIDSALVIANQRLDIARRLHDSAKIASATLNTAEAFLRSGEYDRAINILDTLDKTRLQEYHTKYLNSIYRSAYRMKAETATLPSEKIEATHKTRMLRQKALAESEPDSRGHYTLTAEQFNDAGLTTEAIKTIQEASTLFDFSEDPAMQYTMGEIYLAAGNRQEAIEHLTASAILDISSGTKEYRSLILLAILLFEEGDVERAFEYINCAFEDAEFSKAHFRTDEIMKSMPVINKAYTNAVRKSKEHTTTFLIIVSALSILLLIFLLIALHQYRQKRKMLTTIKLINNELKDKNVLLRQNDALKLQYINTLMMAYAKHISRLRDFRRKIYRLFKASQYEKAMETVTGDKIEAQDIASFHEMFDEAFLSLFPNFVDEINTIMREPIKLKTPGHFTPELRVLAMIRLGMNSTDEISEMFHYSAQTVYNIRTSIRSMITISWSELETFLHNL